MKSGKIKIKSECSFPVLNRMLAYLFVLCYWLCDNCSYVLHFFIPLYDLIVITFNHMTSFLLRFQQSPLSNCNLNFLTFGSARYYLLYNTQHYKSGPILKNRESPSQAAGDDWHFLWLRPRSFHLRSFSHGSWMDQDSTNSTFLIK